MFGAQHLERSVLGCKPHLKRFSGFGAILKPLNRALMSDLLTAIRAAKQRRSSEPSVATACCLVRISSSCTLVSALLVCSTYSHMVAQYMAW